MFYPLGSSIYMEVREQFAGVVSLPLSYVPWGSDSGPQVWQQASPPAGSSSLKPHFVLFETESCISPDSLELTMERMMTLNFSVPHSTSQVLGFQVYATTC